MSFDFPFARLFGIR